jgi:hypothetical protein
VRSRSAGRIHLKGVLGRSGEKTPPGER